MADKKIVKPKSGKPTPPRKRRTAASGGGTERLDVGSGIERFVAWLANAAFGLPLSKEIGNIRAFELPERIGVITMRSLSPYREEEDSVDDGT